jgi:hypothetical protein
MFARQKWAFELLLFCRDQKMSKHVGVVATVSKQGGRKRKLGPVIGKQFVKVSEKKRPKCSHFGQN